MGSFGKINLMKEMFRKMTVGKDASLIPTYYHKDFQLFTNGEEMDYETFHKTHIDYYNTPIQYEVEYDEETFVEGEDKVACRLWITVRKPHESPKKMELVLIAEFRDDKIYRLWELTYPDWSKLPEFQK